MTDGSELELAEIDLELVRLSDHARTTEDVFAASLDWAQIDSLLERRHALTSTSDE